MLFGCTVYPQTYYMNIRMKGGATVSIPLHDVQKLTFSGFTAVGNGKLAAVVKTFALLQNYPNPFNPKTTIEYQLPKSGRVEIRVFNLSGQLVKSIGPEQQVQGGHAFEWDGRNDSGRTVASGMYVYQVVFEKSTLSRRMTFVK
jgi:hypothetical protein